jgi:hypothetical protein
MSRIADTVLQFAVISEQHQAFTIGIESARRIKPRQRYEILERFIPGLGRELANDSIGFVEKDQSGHGLVLMHWSISGYAEISWRKVLALIILRILESFVKF